MHNFDYILSPIFAQKTSKTLEYELDHLKMFIIVYLFVYCAYTAYGNIMIFTPTLCTILNRVTAMAFVSFNIETKNCN